MISGSADTVHTVNTYVDTLKFTTYTPVNSSKAPAKNAFSQVVLAFGKTSQTTTYTITASFDPAIFNQASDVTLTVPQITTTRSAIDQPLDIFKQAGN